MNKQATQSRSREREDTEEMEMKKKSVTQGIKTTSAIE